MVETKILIESVEDETKNKDITIQFEKVLTLLGQPELLGLMISLVFLDQIGFIQFKTQKRLAQVLGFSEPTFIRKRKILEQIGLLEVKEMPNSNRKRINLKFLSRIKNFKLPDIPEKQVKYLLSCLDSLYSRETKEGQLRIEGLKNFKSSSIYKYILSTVINNNTSNNAKKVTFPKADYDRVIKAFQRYKGVGLVGPEIPQHLRAVKTMFKAGRKPKEIIAFMKWLHDHEDDERTPWVKTWTIWTVQKKMAEFVAGKLKLKNLTQEFERI